MRLRLFLLYPACLLFFLLLIPVSVHAQTQVNLPYFGAQSRMNEAAIFWFGAVDNSSNYADIRLGYTDTELKVYLHIMDRYLWYDTNPDISTLTDYDAVSLYLSYANDPPPTISPSEYLFIGQLNWWENEINFQSIFQGTSIGSWDIIAAPLVIESNWRGNAPNDLIDDRGWTMFFTIPFSTLNQPSPPPQGTIWHLGLVLHDLDDPNAPPEPIHVWPTNLSPDNPSTWNQIRFGLPSFSPSAGSNPTAHVIRQDTDFQVIDAHVGGHTDCGGDSEPEFFPTWGDRNYAGYTQMSEQNQWDIADWPCFSKMLFKFPLTSLPSGKVVTQATLTLHQFGNSDPSQAQPSYIQVLTAPPTWDENSVNWNNAPQALENIAASWVDPVTGPIVWPGWRRDWDITYGLTKAYTTDQTEFSLILYSADGDYHSGKYFTSSETGEWNLLGRPTLTITLTDPITTNPYDLDGDNDTDFLDLLQLIVNFNTSGLGNFNLSGLVDIFDLNALISQL